MGETLLSFNENYPLCIRCQHRQPPPYKGVMLCLVNGKPASENAEKGECPKGFFVPDPEGAGYKAKPSTVLKADCRHRGDQTGEERCETCAGVVMLKIFGCAVHGRCCIGKSPDGIRSCATCGEYVAGE